MTQYKHYQTLSDYYYQKYQQKVAKIALNANFTCPNRDGTKGVGGCTYCSKTGSGDSTIDCHSSLQQQFLEVQQQMKKKWPNALYIPYLQAHSNTYADLPTLKRIYSSVLALDPEHIVGLAIATRPDCFNQQIYDYLEELNQTIDITIELGLQTSNEQTAQVINRCCSNQEFIDCVTELRKRHIDVVVHIINGLPNETKQDMLHTIDFLNQFDIQGIKFHSLLILYDTSLYEAYQKEPFPLLTLEEYVDIVVQQIVKLKPNIVIHRLAADARTQDLFLPKWPQKKLVVMNEIDKLLRKTNQYQGDAFKKSNQHH